MKTIILFILTSYSAFCQSVGCVYNVAKIVSGEVLRSDGTPLKIGDVLYSVNTEDFKFVPPNKASIIVISQKCGEMRVFKPSLKDNFLVSAFINYFGFNSEKHPTGTRSKNNNGSSTYTNYYTELQYLFSGSRDPQKPNIFLLLGNSVQFPIDNKYFPQTDNSYFLVTYLYNGNLISRKISHKRNNLILAQNELFSSDNSIISSDSAVDMKLLYVNETSDGQSMKQTFICNFHPFFETDKNVIKTYRDIQKVYK